MCAKHLDRSCSQEAKGLLPVQMYCVKFWPGRNVCLVSILVKECSGRWPVAVAVAKAATKTIFDIDMAVRR